MAEAVALDGDDSFHRKTKAISNEAAGHLKVLIVDDDQANLSVLEAFLRHDGHHICMARDGQEGLALYEKEQPDIVLMDVMMPIMDGYEATRQIKQKAVNHFVPIIFITALTDKLSLAKCVEVGGDDFLTKPVSRIILKAKMAAADRMRRLNQELDDQRNDLAKHHKRLRQEHELAEHIFTKVIAGASNRAENIKVRMSPVAITSGDIVLVERTPEGCQRVLLGDSTGHGLSAAIGAIPITDIFHTMTRKGFGMREIVQEMNRKLHDTLPVGQFIAVCIVEWCQGTSKASIFNAGMSDVLLVNEGGERITCIPSRNLPLGILSKEEYTVDIEVRETGNGDRFYMYSDGVVDARDRNGKEYGQQSLEEVILRCQKGGLAFENICQAIEGHGSDREQEDDITIVEISCHENMKQERTEASLIKNSAMNRTISLRLGPREFTTFDPLIIVELIINGMEPLNSHRAFLYTIITELYANALEHGLLQLDSALKDKPDGYVIYYETRERLLAGLKSGWINIFIECAGDEQGGQITIQMEDSGKGFTPGQTSDMADAAALSGRGVALVKELCKSLDHDRYGSYARAVYDWRCEDAEKLP